MDAPGGCRCLTSQSNSVLVPRLGAILMAKTSGSADIIAGLTGFNLIRNRASGVDATDQADMSDQSSKTGGEDGIKSILSPHQRAMLAKLRETPVSPSRIFTRCGADWVRWVSEWRGNPLVVGERERCGRWAARWAGARFAAWLCPFPLSLAGRLAGSAGWLAGVLRIDTGLVACTNRFRRFQGSISSDSSFDICPSW